MISPRIQFKKILFFPYCKQRLLSEFYFPNWRVLSSHETPLQALTICTKQENKKTSNLEKWKWFPHCNCCLQASCWKSITRPSTRGICLTGQKLPQRTSTQVVEIKHFSWEVKPYFDICINTVSWVGGGNPL